MNIQINDILYTKDGRKSGNLTCIDIKQVDILGTMYDRYIFKSDYGNVVYGIFSDKLWKQFYKTLGKATEGHKYYNYKQTHPEEFI